MKNMGIDDKFDQVKEVYASALAKAKRYLRDPKKLRVIVDEASLKAERSKRQILPAANFIRLFCAVVDDHLTHGHVDIAENDLQHIVAALVYFISPVDVFPDFIPTYGFVDDMFVIGLVAAAVHESLERYKMSRIPT
jgi:uncharacterized membrane protein YkvA (DUF1232 family)